MRKLIATTIMGIGLALAGCTSSGQVANPITFSSIIQAVQNSCNIVLDVTDETAIAAIVAGNPALSTASLIAGYVCTTANALNPPAASFKLGGTKIVIPFVLPNGKTVTVTGTRN